MKSSGSLGKIQKSLGIKSKSKRKVSKKRRVASQGKYWVNPITGRKERVRSLF